MQLLRIVNLPAFGEQAQLSEYLTLTTTSLADTLQRVNPPPKPAGRDGLGHRIDAAIHDAHLDLSGHALRLQGAGRAVAAVGHELGAHGSLIPVVDALGRVRATARQAAEFDRQLAKAEAIIQAVRVGLQHYALPSD